ncbi:PREDICTED: beta-glucosidase 16-like isoform X2 [Brassica oleracea var. oleracea]|uniref:thioglucosidase n=2 Tax=Brassica oleracea TaxID=3712 RepID=A0A0D3BWQ7_BRAOL|nr:PREDICTED: beta-glucosidase 16-like isoform X2 [Brassica oleracea var. oleracea]VDD09373.1 unnamed protein product [Brassica oleracea]
MRSKCLLLLLIITSIYVGVSAKNHSSRPILRRSDFPEDFIFGSATSAYQCEGAAHEDGRGPSIWDTFSENFPEKILDGSNGSIADNSYNLYKEDVNLLHQIGFHAYRFSISWSRILPRGDLKGGINQAGVDYYNNLINQLLLKGMKPFVTIFHWDLPAALEHAYGGFLGAEIVNDFRDYAELCFQKFGDRVKHWVTVNEPFTVVRDAYIIGQKAPGRCSSFTNPNCTGGDGATEPYIVGHNFLLAHGAAVKIYREKYQAIQKGKIGIALNTEWHYPYSDSYADKLAAARATAFTFDYFLEPIVYGRYPAEMVNHVKDGRLPTFTPEESSMLKGSYDFIGLNYYLSFYVKDVRCATENITMYTDRCASTVGERNGVPIGPTAGSSWLMIYPKGIRDLLLHAKLKYNDPVLYITENGVNEPNTGEIFLNDDLRIDYYANHLKMVRDAISMGVNVKGYFAWSLMDNFEWSEGYTVRFGIVYVDFRNGRKRYPKKSAKWFRRLLKGKYNGTKQQVAVM